MPMVAANDTTLAATSSSGATIERSSSASTTKITSRIVGTMTLRSRALASCTSRLVAALPPTRTSLLTASRSDRRRCTVSSASWLSDAALVVACTSTVPSTTFGGTASWPGCGRHEADEALSTPGSLVTTCRAASASASGTTIWIGVADPAGKCSPITCCAMIESVSSRKVSSIVEPPALKVGAKAAAASSTMSVMTQVRRGCRPTRSATRPQSPLVPTTSSACTWSSLGANGQNALRPKSRRTAGRKVSEASRAPAMPRAPTGPSPEVLRSSASSRQSRPRMTVAADATIGSTAPRQARLSATHELGSSCSSSLKRLTSSSA